MNTLNNTSKRTRNYVRESHAMSPETANVAVHPERASMVEGIEGGLVGKGKQSLFRNTVDGHRNDTWDPTQYLESRSRDISTRSSSMWAITCSGANQQFGVAYKITPLHLLDFHFGFGLNAATPSHFFAVGYSFLLDHLWR
jgi:hypothetical protein